MKIDGSKTYSHNLACAPTDESKQDKINPPNTIEISVSHDSNRQCFTVSVVPARLHDGLRSVVLSKFKFANLGAGRGSEETIQPEETVSHGDHCRTPDSDEGLQRASLDADQSGARRERIEAGRRRDGRVKGCGMMNTQYVNPWHNPALPQYGPAMYQTDVKPKEYKGFLVYERIKGVVWDVVRDGRCFTQRAGISGALTWIDEREANDDWKAVYSAFCD